MSRLVCGVGINDCPGWASNHGDKVNSYELRVYNLWLSMLKRCYKETSLKYDESYRGCIVCDEWKTLSKFAGDIVNIPNYQLWKDNPRSKITLDKDYVTPGGRVYSPQTVGFVTASDSSREVCLRYKGTGKGVYSKEGYEKRSNNPSWRASRLRKHK